MGSGVTDQYLAYLGANVRRLRLKQGMTQPELAESIDMDLRFLQRIESGAVNLRFHSFIRLAERLGVAPAVLLRKVKVHEKVRGRPRKNSAARSARTRA